MRFWREKGVPGTFESEGTAVKEALNALFHTEFKWMTTWPGGMEDRPPDLESCLWEDDGTKTKMEDGTIHVKGAMNRLVLTNGTGAIVLLSWELSRKVFYDSNLDAVCDCIADLPGQEDPFHAFNGELKCEYSADGLPVRVYGRHHDSEDSGCTVWRRSDYQEENLIWVFRPKLRGGKVILKPLEIWTADNLYPGRLIWRLKDSAWSEEWNRKFLHHE